MPSLAHIANLWTLVGHPAPGRPWSLDRQLSACAEAGFDGVTGGLTPEHRRLAARHGLRHLIGFVSSNSGDPAEYERQLRGQKEGGAEHVNVQLDDHDTPPAVAVRHWIALERAATRLGLVASLEVHRDTCTETPEKTWEIADRYRRATGRPVVMNFDFSHLAVVKHLAPEHFTARLLVRPDLVRRSVQAHCRPFNGHHCQVAVTHRGRLTPEVRAYLAFIRDFFRCWKTAPANRNRTLFVCPELGPYPSGYNLTGLPPAWPDAIVLRRELDRAWREA